MFVLLPLILVAGLGSGLVGVVFSFVASAWLLMRKKYDEVLLLLFFVLIMGDSRSPYFAFFKDVRIALVLFVGLISFFYIKTRGFKLDKSIIFLFPFFFVSVLSFFYSPIPFVAFPRTISFFLIPFIVFHFGKYVVLDTGGVFFSDIVLFGLCVLLLGDIVYVFNPSLVSYFEGIDTRVQGVFGNPNGLAIFSFLLFALVLYLRRNSILFSRGFFNFSLFLIFLNVVLSGSRTSLACIIILLVGGWIMSKSLKFRLLFIFIFLPAVLFLGGAIFWNIVSSNEVLALRFRVETIESAGGRLEPWLWGYDQVWKAPFVGKGFGYDSFVYQSKIPYSLRSVYRGWNAAFSGVLALLLDVGFLGLGLLILFWGRLFSCIKDRKFILPFLLALVLSSVFESWVAASLNAFMILFYFTLLSGQAFPLQNDNP